MLLWGLLGFELPSSGVQDQVFWSLYSVGFGVLFGVVLFLNRRRTFLDKLSSLQRIRGDEKDTGLMKGYQAPDPTSLHVEGAKKLKADYPELFKKLDHLNSNLVRDFITFWYPISVTADNEDFQNMVKKTCIYAETLLLQRARRVDWMSFASNHVITALRDLLRIYINTGKDLARTTSGFKDLTPEEQDQRVLDEIKDNYQLHVACQNPKEEVKYCRQVSTSFLEELLPPSDFNCELNKIFLREIFCNIILYPNMAYAEPYYMNWVICMALGVYDEEEAKEDDAEESKEGDGDPEDSKEASKPPAAAVGGGDLVPEDRESPSLPPPDDPAAAAAAAATGDIRDIPAPKDNESPPDPSPNGERRKSNPSESGGADSLPQPELQLSAPSTPTQGPSDPKEAPKPVTLEEAPSLLVFKTLHNEVISKHLPPFTSPLKFIGGLHYKFKFKLSKASPIHFRWIVRDCEPPPVEDGEEAMIVSGSASTTHDLMGKTSTDAGKYSLVLSSYNATTKARTQIARIMVDIEASVEEDSSTGAGSAAAIEEEEPMKVKRMATSRSILRKLNPVTAASKTVTAVANVARRPLQKKTETRVERIHMIQKTEEELHLWELRNPEIRFDQSTIQWDPKPYARYCLEITDGPFKWRIFKRYSQFFELHRKLVKSVENLTTKVPKKQAFGNLDAKFIDARKKSLQSYMRSLCWSKKVIECSHFRNFLIPPKTESKTATAEPTNTPGQQNGENTMSLDDAIYLRATMNRTNKRKRKQYYREMRRRDATDRLYQSNIMNGIYALAETFLALEKPRTNLDSSVLSMTKIVTLFIHGSLTSSIIEATMEHSTPQNATKLTQVLLDSLWPNGVWYTPAPLPTPEIEAEEKAKASEALLAAIPNLPAGLAEDHFKLCIRKFHRFLNMETVMKHFLYTLLDAVTEEIFISFRKRRQQRSLRFES